MTFKKKVPPHKVPLNIKNNIPKLNFLWIQMLLNFFYIPFVFIIQRQQNKYYDIFFIYSKTAMKY